MGNSQTKESRGSRLSGSNSPALRQDIPPPPEPTARPSLAARPRRGSRPDFSFLGIGGNNEQDTSSLETRRENKAEREARKLEKERIARVKERERSMKEEHVDGGYLVTLGVYVGVEDFNKATVRQLQVCVPSVQGSSLIMMQIERRLAPFWTGLNDFSESWAEHQLMAAARGLPIPAADEVPPELEYRLTQKTSPDPKEKSTKSLTIPITARSQSYQSDNSGSLLSPSMNSLPATSPPQSATSPSTPLFRTRAKTLASLTTSSRNNPEALIPREFQLPKDPFVNGQPIEAYLYKDASECPICFLYYPPYLNTTRCCEQAICSECFVQIKRPDPHAPEHEQPDPNAPPMSAEDREAQEQGLLVSEVATCPYCKTPEFGITYGPPPFRRGLTYGSGSQPYQIMSARSSQTSISSSGLSPGPGRRRGTSLSATAPEVITTDKVRPDWASKLSTARAHAARRSAAATALHTAAYLMNGQDAAARPFGPFARRPVMRRPTLEGENSQNSHLSALAMLAERQAARNQEDPRASPFLPPPRASSSRRSRMDDLEEMMMLEAIRLSLASEDDRRKKEDKDAKKKAKKEEKEQEKQRKKDEKSARKSSLFTTTSNGDGGGSLMERSRSNLSSIADDESSVGKGKGIERSSTPPIGITGPDDNTPRPYLPNMSFAETSEESLAQSIPVPGSAEPFRRSHLRQMSNASSASSSIADPTLSGSYPGSSTPPPGSLEPMFNFRSLAAMIGEEEKAAGSSHVENAEEVNDQRRPGSLEELRDGEGESPPSSTNSQSQDETSPQLKGKEVDEKHKDELNVTGGAGMGPQSDASKV